MGQFFKIQRESNGQPMKQWIEEVPNDGLIRYCGLLGRERVILTTSQALSEVLTQKTYEFIKPPSFTGPLGRMIGVGLVLAEGDEHRVGGR